MANIKIDEEALRQAEALMEEFKNDTLGPAGSIGQPGLCETLKNLSNCLAGMNEKYGDFISIEGDPAAGFVDILNATYAINDIAKIIDVAGNYKFGDMSREECAYEIAYSIMDLGSRITGGIGKMNFGTIGTYCSLILGTGAACLKYGKGVIDMRLQQLEDATFILDHLDDPDLWPDSSSDLRAYLEYSGIEEEDIEELLDALDELETQMGTVQSNLEYIKHLEYLESKAAVEELDNFINEVNNWVKDKEKIDIPVAPEDDTNLETNPPSSEEKTEFKSSYKGSGVSNETLKSMTDISSSSSSGGYHFTEYVTISHNLKNQIEFEDNDLIDYFKELMESDPDVAREKHSELLKNIEKSKGYLSDDENETLENLQDLADQIGEELPDILSNECDKSTEIQPPRDPLIIDLGTPNLELKSIENGAHFDLDKNGFAEKTAWIGEEDGFLAIDRNGNGIIDDGGELFSDYVIKKDGTKAINGFDALEDFDDNVNEETGEIGDGVIDEKDSRFKELRVWVDKDNYGITDEGELNTLEYHNIKSISLNILDPENSENSNDNSENKKLSENFFNAEVKFANEETTKISEHWFEVKTHDTVEKDENGNNIIAGSVEAFGNIKNLNDAMREDDKKTLSNFVRCFKNSEDYAEKRVLVKKILFSLTDSTELDPNARGGNIDARELNVVEKFMGRNFIGAEGTSTPNSLAAPILQNVYYQIETLYFNLLNKESISSKYISQVYVTRDNDGNASIDFSAFNYSVALGILLDKDIDDAVYSVASILKQYDFLYGTDSFSSFTTDYVKLTDHFNDMEDKILIQSVVYGADGNDIIQGTVDGDILWGDSGNDTITAGNGNDFIYGGTGNDTMNGGDGNDSYYFNLGDGQDIINEENSRSNADRVVFGEGITQNDVKITRDGGDMILTVGDNGDSIRIAAQFTNAAYQVETFEFADGSTIKTEDILNNPFTIEGSGTIKGFDNGLALRDEIFIGSETADTIYGYSGDDTITGSKGNDILYGGYGNDTYIFNLGDGQDIINEENSRSNADRVVFGEGITQNDVKITRDGNDMILTVGDNGDSIRIARQFTITYAQIESFEFADGTISHIDLSTSEFVNDYVPEMDAVEANAAMLAELYSDDTELRTAHSNTLSFEQTVSINENNNISADKSDIQVMILTENMSTFADEANVYDTANITDTTTDTTLNQLLVNSAV